MARVRIEWGGAAALLIAMGIGRFAFTPLLPVMQAEMGFSHRAAGAMASVNLLGYLLGAMAAGSLRFSARPVVYRWALLGSTLCVLAMAAPLGVMGWTALRFTAGLSSGLIFVLAAGFVLEARAAQGGGGSALHFTGIGLGVALSGAVVQFLPEWRIAWIALAAISALLTLPAWTIGHHSLPAPRAAAAVAATPRPAIFTLLVCAYTCEGFGYIISGTFLVSLLRQLPATASLGPLSWVLVGLAAAPSIPFWAWVTRRVGAWRALTLAYAAQAIGVALPLTGNAAAALLSAVLFGGTFTAIVGLSLSLGARLSPHGAGRAAARLTVIYSIGQVVGPSVAAALAGANGDFTLPLGGAALVIACGSALSLLGHVLTTPHAKEEPSHALCEHQDHP